MEDETLVYIGKEALCNLIKSIPYDFDELKAFWGFDEELNRIRDSIFAVADLVEDAEKKQLKKADVRLWLRDLKAAAYEADDLLSELAYETTRLHIQKKAVHNFSPVVNNRKATFRLKMASDLDRVIILFKTIQMGIPSLKLRSIAHYWEDLMSQNRSPTDLNLENPVLGREGAVKHIVNLLTTSNHERLTVVPIRGIGGLGKTTLAKLVSKEVMETRLFDISLWIDVSGEFNEKRILREMLEQLNPTIGALIHLKVIVKLLNQELRSKRFLLVLDDVWADDISTEWSGLKARLLEGCANSGNAIIVTTRDSKVASVVEASSQGSHILGGLSNEECLSILEGRVYRNIETPTAFVKIIKAIADSCGGVPLVAKILGGTMGYTWSKHSWLEIAGSIRPLNPTIYMTDVDAVLKLCFDYLPSYMKPCFAFCSIFPKGFSIQIEEMIQLWMAEGLIGSLNDGNHCVNILLWFSFLQEVERDEDGNVTQCKMHDLVHDLASSLSKFDVLKRENCSIDILNYGAPAKKLHTIILDSACYRKSWTLKSLRILSQNGVDMEVFPSSIGRMKHLRYLKVSNSKIRGLPKSITKLYNLQTLNLSNSKIKELPKYITNLYNLQTLNLSNSTIKELPESITKLCNLQTLKFLECKELTKLPRKKINNLISLKHIAFSYEHQMPSRMGKLNGLETLPFFVVGPDWGGCIQELECLSKLRGNLEITRLEEVVYKEEAERANLHEKTDLRGLGLQWSYGENNRTSRDEEFLESLRPHSNIKRLKIKYYMGEKWPSWMMRMKSPSYRDCFAVINNLVDLKLEQCWSCVRLPCLGNLPCLKFLQINHMRRVKCIDTEFYWIEGSASTSGCLRLFPTLKSLCVSWMENLAEWSCPSSRYSVVFPRLENLSIQSCAKLTSFPMYDLPALVKLEIKDCEDFRFLFDKQQSFPSLTSLSIVGCSKLTYLRNWLPSSTCFKEFCIRRCEWLVFIPEDLGKLSSLTSLEMYFCKRLRYFPGEILSKFTKLRKLCIGAFSEELDDFCYLNRIKDIPYLEELEIWGSDFFGREMSSLPNQLQHLTVLKSLKIMGFTAMESLPEWLTNLQSLQFLSLYCRNLRCPSTAKVIQRLYSLTHLNINCCPILERSKSQWLPSLDTKRIKVEFSDVSKVRVRLGY